MKNVKNKRTISKNVKNNVKIAAFSLNCQHVGWNRSSIKNISEMFHGLYSNEFSRWLVSDLAIGLFKAVILIRSFPTLLKVYTRSNKTNFKLKNLNSQ